MTFTDIEARLEDIERLKRSDKFIDVQRAAKRYRGLERELIRFIALNEYMALDAPDLCRLVFQAGRDLGYITEGSIET